MAAVTICSDFGASKNKSLTLFPLFPHLFPMKWWDWMPRPSFSECWALSQISVHFNSVQLLSRVRLFVTPWIAARQASLSITNSRSSLRVASIESAMPSSHLILCRPLLLLPPIPPSIKVFSYESTLHMRWPKCWSFSVSIIPSKVIPGLIFICYQIIQVLCCTRKSRIKHIIFYHYFTL